jgi:hypothetical protein
MLGAAEPQNAVACRLYERQGGKIAGIVGDFVDVVPGGGGESDYGLPAVTAIPNDHNVPLIRLLFTSVPSSFARPIVVPVSPVPQ